MSSCMPSVLQNANAEACRTKWDQIRRAAFTGIASRGLLKVLDIDMVEICLQLMKAQQGIGIKDSSALVSSSMISIAAMGYFQRIRCRPFPGLPGLQFLFLILLLQKSLRSIVRRVSFRAHFFEHTIVHQLLFTLPLIAPICCKPLNLVIPRSLLRGR